MLSIHERIVIRLHKSPRLLTPTNIHKYPRKYNTTVLGDLTYYLKVTRTCPTHSSWLPGLAKTANLRADLPFHIGCLHRPELEKVKQRGLLRQQTVLMLMIEERKSNVKFLVHVPVRRLASLSFQAYFLPPQQAVSVLTQQSHVPKPSCADQRRTTH